MTLLLLTVRSQSVDVVLYDSLLTVTLQLLEVTVNCKFMIGKETLILQLVITVRVTRNIGENPDIGYQHF
jgi:hypothetical protein